jgi:hypothetical protein
MMENDDRKARLFALMERFNQLGRLLPSEDDVSAGERIPEAKLIISEMKKVEAEIAALLGRKRLI